MTDFDESGEKPIHAKAYLGANGRIVIPAAIREQLGIKPGDPILMEAEEGVLRIESVPTRIARIQREVARFIPPGVSLVDELIAERREEARREEEEFQRSMEEERRRRDEKIA